MEKKERKREKEKKERKRAKKERKKDRKKVSKKREVGLQQHYVLQLVALKSFFTFP